jgi:hypothetical protein
MNLVKHNFCCHLPLETHHLQSLKLGSAFGSADLIAELQSDIIDFGRQNLSDPL